MAAQRFPVSILGLALAFGIVCTAQARQAVGNCRTPRGALVAELEPDLDSAAASQGSRDSLMDEGLRAFRSGEFGHAIQAWSAAALRTSDDRSKSNQVTTLLWLTRAYESDGQLTLALASARRAWDLAKESGDRKTQASTLTALSNIYTALGELELASRSVTQALQLAREESDPGLLAAALNHQAKILATQGDNLQAAARFAESAALAAKAGDSELAARARANRARVSIDAGQFDGVGEVLAAATENALTLPDSHQKARLLLNIGQSERRLASALPESHDELILRSAAAFNLAQGIAESSHDARSVSFAWGYLGRLYEEEQRHEEALELTRKALFAAQHVNAPDALYRWQWQAGRIHQAKGNTDEAIAAYRGAAATLNSLRSGTAFISGHGSASFEDSVEPVYFTLVGLLLERAHSTEDAEHRQGYLREARDRYEQLKTVELQDYFRDDCIAPQQTTAPDAIPRTVVVYPIMLADRTELIVSLPTGLRSIRVPIDKERLTAEVKALRRYLEKRTTREYLPHAQTLYDWLVRPVENAIGDSPIDVLVFVPDNVLRTIPMGALHDRETRQFLIEKFPLAITPGLTLTDPRQIDRSKVSLLMAGLTKSVQGHPALVNVPVELDAIRSIFGGRELVDEDFLEASIERELDNHQFTIVHIASHGEFAADGSQSFLLTYDGRLPMDRLGELVRFSQFHDQPLELLALSACQTAVGDERAALGLAGVAVRSGARSALATLWSVNDRATAVLVSEFYAALSDPSTSRAQALQRAKLKLLKSRAHRHPGYWSPFLLISNWL